MMKSSEDRGGKARGLMEKAGCKLLHYYARIHNYKNYAALDTRMKTILLPFGALHFRCHCRSHGHLHCDVGKASKLDGVSRTPE